MINLDIDLKRRKKNMSMSMVIMIDKLKKTFVTQYTKISYELRITSNLSQADPVSATSYSSTGTSYSSSVFKNLVIETIVNNNMLIED